MPDQPTIPAIYDDDLSLPTLLSLLATYTEHILRTNEMGEDIAYANRCTWGDAFVFGFPKAEVLREVNRMAAWCAEHRAEVDAARREAQEDEVMSLNNELNVSHEAEIDLWAEVQQLTAELARLKAYLGEGRA